MKCIVVLVIAMAALPLQCLGVDKVSPDKDLEYPKYTPKEGDLAMSRAEYAERLQGFWLGQCIANWTGLRTEGQRKKAPFFTDEDWGSPGRSGPIEFVLVEEGDVWLADDDTDVEYIYQHALDTSNRSVLTPKDIRDAWLKHIRLKDDGGPAYLWVSNAHAWGLMKKGMLPPDTSDPRHNHLYDMIDAQLTTEIFGLFAPARPDTALKMAHLPIRTTAYQEAEWMSEFYVIMHCLAPYVDQSMTMQQQTAWLAEQARKRLPEESVAAKMYDFVKADYEQNPDKDDWERTRDALYEKYQVNGDDGYRHKSFFAAGINYGASIVSLLYGQGDFKRTLKIGSLSGWDSDNPTATWGGLLGFMLGPEGVEKAFGSKKLSRLYKISRTRDSFPDRTPDEDGEDTFELMAQRGVHIIDRVVIDEMGGGVDLEKDLWYIPNPGAKIERADYVAVKQEPSPKGKAVDISGAVEKFAPGWTVKDCGSDMDPGMRDQYLGRENVLVTHPLSESNPCSLSTKLEVPDSKKAGLRLDVAPDPRGDWVLVVRADGKTIAEEKIGKDTVADDGWKSVTVDLSEFAGKTVNLELLNKANGWSWEAGYWSKIDIVK